MMFFENILEVSMLFYENILEVSMLFYENVLEVSTKFLSSKVFYGNILEVSIQDWGAHRVQGEPETLRNEFSSLRAFI